MSSCCRAHLITAKRTVRQDKTIPLKRESQCPAHRRSPNRNKNPSHDFCRTSWRMTRGWVDLPLELLPALGKLLGGEAGVEGEHGGDEGGLTAGSVHTASTSSTFRSDSQFSTTKFFKCLVPNCSLAFSSSIPLHLHRGNALSWRSGESHLLKFTALEIHRNEEAGPRLDHLRLLEDFRPPSHDARSLFPKLKFPSLDQKKGRHSRTQPSLALVECPGSASAEREGAHLGGRQLSMKNFTRRCSARTQGRLERHQPPLQTISRQSPTTVPS